MPFTKKSIEEQIEQWENTRSKGRRKYVLNTWVIPYGIIMPLVSSFILIAIPKGNPIKAWCVFIVIFEPICIIFTLFAGIYSWKYFEERYERWNKEKREGTINLPGTIKPFDKHNQLLVGIYSIAVSVLNLLSLIPFFILGWIAVTYNLNLSNKILLAYGILFFSVLILSFLPILNVMVFVKNPICGHGILSNPQEHKHPEAKGNYWQNAWKILKGYPFVCLDCADQYMFRKQGKKFEIIKIEKEGRK